MRIGLIGPVRVEIAGAPAALPGARPTAMLAMLALADDGRAPRATLLDRFWGERPEAKAAAAFRQTLHTLRRALGPEGGRLRSGGGVVALDLDGAAVDLRAETARPLLRPAAERAALAALATREALAGLAVTADEAEAWIAEVRAGWRTYAARALRANLAAALAEADWRGAWALARALEGLEPYCETAQLALMRAEAAIDGPGAALRRRDAFAARLDSELGVAPTAGFDAAARRLRREGADRGRPGRAGPGSPPVAALRWAEDAAGMAGLARNTLARELSRMGVPVLLAEPEAGVSPARYAVSGGFAATEEGRELRIEVLAPDAPPLLLARLPLRRAEDVRAFGRRVAAAAREAGRRLLAHEAATRAGVATGADAGWLSPGWLAPGGLDGPTEARVPVPSAAPAAAPEDGGPPAGSEPVAAVAAAPAAGFHAAFAAVAAPPAEPGPVVAASVSIDWDVLDRAAAGAAGAEAEGAAADALVAAPPAEAPPAPAGDAVFAAAPGDRPPDTLDFLPRAAPPAAADPDDEAAEGAAAPPPWEQPAATPEPAAPPPPAEPPPDPGEAAVAGAGPWRVDADHLLAA